MRFVSSEAGKVKYHLCVHLNGRFIFLNSPKSKAFRGDLVVPCSEIPCVPATPSGYSVISCNLVMHKTNAQLKAAKAVCLGSVSVSLLRKVLQFVEDSPVLSDEEKDQILDGLGDWL